MKFFIGAVFVAVAIAGLVLASGGDDSSTEATINKTQPSALVSQINDELNKNTASLLDVRSPAEFADSHAVGAINHDVELLKVGQMPELDKDEKLYLYCRSGNRSAQAKALLEDEGFTNIVDLGAFDNWRNNGGAVES